MAVLPEGYRRLLSRAVEVLGSDQRVRAMWLGGSLASGAADSASDLDVLLAVADEDHGGFAAQWREWLAAITPTVLAEPLTFLPGSFYSVTPDFERFDVVVESVGALTSTAFRWRVSVFDNDDLTQTIPAPEGRGPSGERIGTLIREFFFHSAKVEVLVWRRDWLLGAEHAHWLRSVVYQLFVEANAPLPPIGLKQWSRKLTIDQRQVLAALPTDITNDEQLVTAHRAAARAFLPTARRLADVLGITWPQTLEDAASHHVEGVLRIPDPYS
jgi:hypothetical protein